MRVFLVDDHELFRDGLRALLEGISEVEVSGEAGNSKDALSLLEERECDVALIDLKLGSEDGVDLVRSLRARYPELPILMLTMHDALEKVQASIEAGANGYLLKAGGRDELFAALQAAATGGSYFCGQVAAPLLRTLSKSESSLPQLSQRETDVLKLVIGGLSNSAISQELHLSVSRVKFHISALFSKFKVKDRTSLAVEASNRGFHQLTSQG